MGDDYVIRFQLVERDKEKALESFDMEIPEYVYGVLGDKSEAPFLVAKQFFQTLKVRVGPK